MGAPLIPTDPFATVALLAAYLRVDIDDGDLMANAALAASTAAIQSYADATISYVADETVKLDGTGNSEMLLPERPVLDVSEVIQDWDLESPTTLTPPGNMSETEYDWTTSGILIRRHSTLLRETGSFRAGWGTRRKSIQVTYTHGYATTPTSTERALTVTGAASNVHIAVAGFNADVDTLLQVVDLSTPADDTPPVSPLLTATEDGYGIKVAENTASKSLLVTWTHPVPSLPYDLQLVCVAAAARAYAQDGATQESTGAYSVTYSSQPATLSKDEMRVVDRYRSRRS